MRSAPRFDEHKHVTYSRCLAVQSDATSFDQKRLDDDDDDDERERYGIE